MNTVKKTKKQLKKEQVLNEIKAIAEKIKEVLEVDSKDIDEAEELIGDQYPICPEYSLFIDFVIHHDGYDLHIGSNCNGDFDSEGHILIKKGNKVIEEIM